MLVNGVNKHLGMDLLDRTDGFALLQEKQEIFRECIRYFTMIMMFWLIVMGSFCSLKTRDMAGKPG